LSSIIRPYVPHATAELIARLGVRYPNALVCANCAKLISTLVGPRDGWCCAECRAEPTAAGSLPVYTRQPDPPGPAVRVKVAGGVVHWRTILDRIATSETSSPDSLTPFRPPIELRASVLWLGVCVNCQRRVGAAERPTAGWRCRACGGEHALVTVAASQEPASAPLRGLRAAAKRLRGVRGRPGLGAARRRLLTRRFRGRPVSSDLAMAAR
jgi:ribosomal protein L37AE/L43A